MLVQKYFEGVDPVYPIINRCQFMAEHDRFWALSQEQKNSSDPAIIGLYFVVYAMGTQLIEHSTDQQRKQVAEFYASAAHQALRISSYLNRGSFYTVQALVMMCYFLMNDNKASDAWGFGGILVRHVYAMGLHRDPDFVVPHASFAEKQQRRKLWQAVLFQDTFLTVLLRLPPTTTFTDVNVDSLIDEPGVVQTPVPATSPPLNPMSISSIAPSPSETTMTSAPTTPGSTAAASNDCSFIRSMWKLANFVQVRVCEPRALGRALAASTADRENTIAQFQGIFDSFPSSLTTADEKSFNNLAARNPRRARQNLFCRSNYWHCMMMLRADGSRSNIFSRDVEGAIVAGRRAILAFFNLWDWFRVDAGVWWVFQHRAFEEAVSSEATSPSSRISRSLTPISQLTIAELLGVMADYVTSPQTPASAPSPSGAGSDSMLQNAKADVKRVLDILEQVCNAAPDMQRTRTEVLRKAIEKFHW